MGNVYIALLHHPVYNKRGDVVTTCITGFDLHDIARTAATYGIKKYFVVNPLPTQREFAKKIFEFWMDEASLEFNWTRAEAFKLISIQENLDAAIDAVTKEEGRRPKIIATSAKQQGKTKFEDLKFEIRNSSEPYLILFGTGWGMTEELLGKADGILEPIVGPSPYNHLSVRSACAIILDRLLGERTNPHP
ncbi:MAG: RNA methyltransferase [Candidatus Margulisiibacteriota bacterium]